jgi:hypothetical protein
MKTIKHLENIKPEKLGVMSNPLWWDWDISKFPVPDTGVEVNISNAVGLVFKYYVLNVKLR